METALSPRDKISSPAMKAVVKCAPGAGNIRVVDVEEPQCGSKEVKVEIAFCGVCGTDLHVLNDTFRNYPPVILGHEFSGTVVEVGSEVTTVLVGDRVTGLGATAVNCGECEFCLQGYFNLLPATTSRHGSWGQWCIYALCYSLPPDGDS